MLGRIYTKHFCKTIGDYEGFYKKFFASPNFRGWFENRRQEQLKALEELHQEAIAKEDFNKWIRGKQEVIFFFSIPI